jgi:hypothetical protein
VRVSTLAVNSATDVTITEIVQLVSE